MVINIKKFDFSKNIFLLFTGIPKFVQDILLKIKEENDDEEATARPKPTPHVQGK